MGFLSGVLSNIKEHLGQHKDELNNAIKSLNDNKHAGKKGFNAAIVKVVEGVGRYNDAVMKSNNLVKSKIEAFDRDMKRLKETVSEILKNNAASGQLDAKQLGGDEQLVDEKAGEYLQCAENFTNNLDMNNNDIITRNAINDLNDKLRDKIEVARGTMLYETKRLAELLAKERQELRATKGKLIEVFKKLGDDINERITKEVTELVRKLKKLVSDILRELKTISSRLAKLFNALHDWIRQAEWVINEALLKVEIILKAVDDKVSGNHPNLIKSAVQQIQTHVQLLHTAGEEAKKIAGEEVEKAVKAVTHLEDAIRYELNEVKMRIASRIGTYVKNELLTDIKRQVEGIAGHGGIRGECLKGVQTKLKGYADRFTENGGGFGNVVEKWIANILKENDYVKEKVENYVAAYKGSYQNDRHTRSDGSPDYDEISKTIAVTIKDKFKEMIIQEELSAFNVTDINDNITENVKKVAGSCKKFATALESKMKTIIAHDTIAKAVGDSVWQSYDESTMGLGNRHDLQEGIRRLLITLSATARRAGEAIESLLLSGGKVNLTTMVQTALDRATSLYSNIERVIGSDLSAGSGVYAEKFDHKLNTILDQQLGATDPHRSSNKVVNLEKLPTAFHNSGNSKKDALDDAINKIGGEVSSALSTIQNLKDDADSQLYSITASLKRLCDDITKEADNPNGLKKVLTEFRDEKLKGVKESQLNKINNDISQLQSDLEKGPVKLCNIFIENHANQLQNSTVQTIKQQVNKEVDAARNTITIHAQMQYVSAIKALLLAFSDKATKELQPLPGEIDEDLRIGFKGLMRVMGGMKSTDGLPANNGKSLLDSIKELAQPPASSASMKDNFTKLSTEFNSYFTPIYTYIKEQINNDTSSDPQALKTITTANTKHLTDVNSKFTDLLEHLKTDPKSSRTYIFDITYTTLLSHLSSSLAALTPSHFANPRHPELLDAVKKGLEGFVTEMEKVYVNGYDDGNKIDWDNFVIFTGHQVTPEKEGTALYKITPDGTKLAKIFCTIFNFIYEDFIRLKNKCDDNWKDKILSVSMNNEDNPLGLFLQRCGYLVAKSDTSKDGETQCRRSITGADILGKVTANIDNRQITSHLTTCESNLTDEGDPKKQAPFNFADLLDCLLNHIDKYNEVCHYSTHFARRQPCSVYEMLIWLSGLPYSVARPALLQDGIGNLLDNPNKKAIADVDGISLLDHESSYLDANPRNITWYGITEALELLCSTSYDLLVGIAGTGDADTIYGSDLCNNSFKFKYPTSGEECLDMLLDILRRLFPPLRFLQTQCSVGASHNGWLQCGYGRDALPANWPCKEHPSDKSKCQPTCPPNCQPNCQPKSPLMSFLSDCHVGCLPHQLTSIGCKYDCKTCPTNKPGMPCLTPLGFRGFSGSMKTGKDLCNVLAKFFGNPYLSSFLCLAPKAPSTLPEHFAFTLSLVTGWNNHSRYDDKTLKNSIDKSINGVSIDLYKNASELTDAVSNAYSHCTAALPKCDDSHLMDLTSSSTCNKDQYSAPYLESLCADSYLYLANKHSNAYLSWVLYLPWNFHKYLESLLGAFKDIFCNDWGCRSCLNGKCKKGEHGVLDNTCQCASMVKCSGVMPTLYRYGFAFQDAPTLDARKSAMKCFEFQTVLYKVTRSNYFSKLFDECDNFLYQIRFPFMSLTLSLWLLSFLYLLHIMVIRLDLLHIKSHLHSPSSHRIAAQSLLAAGRVNKLGKVFYLQP